MPEVPVVSRNMIAYLISLLSVAPSYRSLDPCIISRTYKLFAVCLATMAVQVTKTSVPTCITRLLDGTGSFLPSGAPTVPTRMTCALASRKMRARRVQSPRLLKREQSRCPTMIRTRHHEMKPDLRSFFM